MKAAKNRGDIVSYDRHNTTQNGLKVIVNSIYGNFNFKNNNCFRPVMASSITYCGRLYLTRLTLFAIKFFCLRNLSLCDRGVLYGDTDSIFISCPKKELELILSEFEDITFHKGIVRVELERTLSHALFLAKKKYVLKEISPSNSVYAKNVFTKNLCPPARHFLSCYLNSIFFIWEKLFQMMSFQKELSIILWTLVILRYLVLVISLKCLKI